MRHLWKRLRYKLPLEVSITISSQEVLFYTILKTMISMKRGWHRETGLSPQAGYFLTVPRSTSFVDSLCYFCLVFVMLSRLFIVALWSPAWKGLTSWLLFVMFNCVFVTFPCGILG